MFYVSVLYSIENNSLVSISFRNLEELLNIIKSSYNENLTHKIIDNVLWIKDERFEDDDDAGADYQINDIDNLTNKDYGDIIAKALQEWEDDGDDDGYIKPLQHFTYSSNTEIL